MFVRRPVVFTPTESELVPLSCYVVQYKKEPNVTKGNGQAYIGRLREITVPFRTVRHHHVTVTGLVTFRHRHLSDVTVTGHIYRRTCYRQPTYILAYANV